MNLGLILIIIIGGYYFYKKSTGNKDAMQDTDDVKILTSLKQDEELFTKFDSEILIWLKLAENNSRTESDPEGGWKKSLSNLKARKQEIDEMRDKFIRLMTAQKYKDIKTRLQTISVWKDYLSNLMSGWVYGDLMHKSNHEVLLEKNPYHQDVNDSRQVGLESEKILNELFKEYKI